ncbi:hypothetical protein BKA04_002195 [Cryobacterium mesophilum]|uniref:ATP synthase protein I n=1 Tax=Terrimesophilobacter mesophilus TaxID=433647 RepID=A0A4R8VEN2_9MICO|nr:hypothetical protein [Terrimesophilobacter mesophilus]MBB5633972.1 hypothetical protein [Terrimesophilobacter mesophilus]TFB80632.1 hypothetical protein E3N84_11690 [Terrimesophilobacter mesophilus]
MKDSVVGQDPAPHRAVSPVYSKALRYGAVVTLGIAVVGSVVGYLVVGLPGVFSALMGALLAMVFMGLTAASILVASRVTEGAPPPDVRFFAIIMGTWFVKLLVFIGVAIWLRSQSWLDPAVFSIAAIVAVIGLLIADIAAFQTSRVPYVDVALPGDGSNSTEKTTPNS